MTLKMICDQYANYVLQTALLKYRNSLRVKQVLVNIKQQVKVIHLSDYGAKVLLKLAKVYDFLGQGEVRVIGEEEGAQKKLRPNQA